MKRLYKDIIIIFIYNLYNTVYSQWPLIYPYLISYSNHYNPSINMKKGFFTTLFVFLGIPLSGFILPHLYFLFGIKRVMMLGGFFFLLNCIFFFYFTNFFALCLNSLFSGFIYQLGITSSSYFLSEKYENGFFFNNYVFMGQNISNFLWPFFCVWIVNPGNRNMIVNEKGESFFPWEIICNFPYLMVIMGICSFFFLYYSTFFFD